MQQQAGLRVAEAGWQASTMPDLVLKDRLYRVGMVVAVLTTAMMGTSTNLGVGPSRATSQG